MQLQSLQLQHFRCFDQTTVQFQPGINLIEGANGSGKTSLLEALHYLCYLRSFRTFFTRELIQAGQVGFFARANFGPALGSPLAAPIPLATATTNLQIGFSPQKRVIKVEQQEVQSYRELLAVYTAVSFVEDDLGLIKGEPGLRRTFLDQFIALYQPNYLKLLADYKRTLVNRNSLLQRAARQFSTSPDHEYQVWTEQLQHKAQPIQAARAQALACLQATVNQLLARYFPQLALQITLTYTPKLLVPDLSALWLSELRFKRSLFGAHLDDFTIQLGTLPARTCASRGQQKLILTLLKLAQKAYLQQLAVSNDPALATAPAFLFLLDDFMTDLDQQWLQTLIQALQDLDSQLIFTAPTQQYSAIRTALQQYPVNLIQL